MTITRYINTLAYTYDKTHAISHYRIGESGYRNKGELLESIAKYHRGIYAEVNPNTAWNTGSDIEGECASVKSSGASLGRGIGGYAATAQEKIAAYFKNVSSTTFIWMHMNEDTQEVIEYHMNKAEFKVFVSKFTRVCNSSNHKELAIRFRKHTKKMEAWFESMATA